MATEVTIAREGGVSSLQAQNAVSNAAPRRRYSDLSWDERIQHAGTYMQNARSIVGEELKGYSHAEMSNGTSSNEWQITPNRTIRVSEATNFDGTMGYKLEIKNSKGKVIRKGYPYNERQLRVGTKNFRKLIENKTY